jgi:hypothetical protein
MPTRHLQKKVTLTKAEWLALCGDKRGKESDSNLLRRKLKLKQLKQGAPANNQNAAVGKP